MFALDAWRAGNHRRLPIAARRVRYESFVDAGLRAAALQDGPMNGLDRGRRDHGSAVPVAHRLRKPRGGDNRSARVVVHGRGRHQAVVVIGEALSLHEGGLPAFRASRHVRSRDRLGVEPSRDLFGDQRDDVSAAPGEVFLEVRCVGRPHTVEAGAAVMPAVRGDGRVPALEGRAAERAIHGAAESSARREEELVIPVGRQRQPKLELVLRRHEARDRAVFRDHAVAGHPTEPAHAIRTLVET